MKENWDKYCTYQKFFLSLQHQSNKKKTKTINNQNQTTERKMLRLINAAEYNSKLKATIQQTGKLGFNKETIEALGLNDQKSIQFAEDDAKKNTLYMIVHEAPNPEAFRINKAGDYVYLNTKVFFESRSFDFKEYNIMFDLVREEKLEDQIPNARVYRMDMRKTKRNKGDDEPGEQS